MVDGMDQVLNAPEVADPYLPVEVGVRSARGWAC
jgi:hypothetical protein